MRKLLNTLYITNPEAYISRDGENVVIKVENNEVMRRPIHILEGIVCFNYVGISPKLMKLCMENNVSVSFVNEFGRFMARVHGEINGNVLLRRTQYRYADNKEISLLIARNCIIGKLVNCRTVLSRSLRDHEAKVDSVGIKHAIEKINRSIENSKTCTDCSSQA